MEFKRYDINSEGIDWGTEVLIESKDGDYILYSDVALIEKQRDELLEALKFTRRFAHDSKFFTKNDSVYVEELIKGIETPTTLTCDGEFRNGERG